jgi:hypothetical protein
MRIAASPNMPERHSPFDWNWLRLHISAQEVVAETGNQGIGAQRDCGHNAGAKWRRVPRIRFARFRDLGSARGTGAEVADGKPPHGQ